LIQRARQFAIDELHLPDSDTFRDYADLKRPWVLWNVFATPELSLQARQWCYPFIGCHGYRVYFNEDYANAVATELEHAGMDVYIAHSPAYSTKGWFADPVYKPMLRYDDLTLVGILFHELAHERVYIIDDSELNESFATVVQNEGVRRWLAKGENSSGYVEYQQEQKRDDDFVKMVLGHRERLQKLYTSDLSEEDKRAGKKKVFLDLKQNYTVLKQSWSGYSGYDHWFEKPLNNARLAPIGTYHSAVEVFQQLLERQQNNLEAFYTAVEKLVELPAEQRVDVLQGLNTR
jgi:predicted aminopeptidase